MTFLIKTILLLGYSSHIFENILFEQKKIYVPEGRAFFSVFPPFLLLRRRTKILFAVLVFVSIILSVLFVNVIISNEYTVRVLSLQIQQNEKVNNDLSVNYFKAHSSDALIREIEKTPKNSLVSVENIKYLRLDTALQANASLK